MDKTMYRLDEHMSYKFSLKISAVYLEYELRKSRFPHNITGGRTDGQTKRIKVVSLLKTKI